MILLDVHMPKMDGFAVCQAVRSSVETMFTPVIMVTGQDSIEEKMRGLAFGADEYITKPFDVPHLLAQIDELLRHSAHAAAEEGENA